MIQPAIPDGFDDFWQTTTQEALESPLDFSRFPAQEHQTGKFQVDTFSFRSIQGETLWGWIAVPESAQPSPAFVWPPPYGRESVLPNEYGTREGCVSLSVNFWGHGPFHQEKYVPTRGYLAEGVASPETWVMRMLFQNSVIAARILRSQPEVDPRRVAAMGMSQGAGIALWLGTWVDWVGAVCADMPFLGGISQTLGEHIYRYPLKELLEAAPMIPGGLERIKSTLSFFDTVNIASRCAKPTQISLGEKDPAVRPASAEAVFEALPGPKRLIRYPGGHDWDPEMIANNESWLMEAMA